MKTSTVAWTLTALIILIGLAWYVYANSSQSPYPTPITNTPVVTNPGPDYTPANTVPSSTTPVASSTTSVTSSTTVNIR